MICNKVTWYNRLHIVHALTFIAYVMVSTIINYTAEKHARLIIRGERELLFISASWHDELHVHLGPLPGEHRLKRALSD